jgi:hypothetical protein
MSLHHFPHQAIDGSWHAVYKTPGTNVLNSVADCISEASAKRECTERNKEQRRMASIAAQSEIHPADRKIPQGFYQES